MKKHVVRMRNMQCTIVWIYPNTVTKFREVPLLAPPGEKPEIKTIKGKTQTKPVLKNVLVEVFSSLLYWNSHFRNCKYNNLE